MFFIFSSDTRSPRCVGRPAWNFARWLVLGPWFLLLCRIHFPWLFPDFPEQNELFSLTNLFMWNTKCWLSITCNNTRNKGGRTNEKIKVNNLRAKRAEKILNCCMQYACNSSVFFSASLLTFAPWYFWIPDFLWPSEFSLALECKNSLTFRFSNFSLTFPDCRNHDSSTVEKAS